MKNIFIQLSKGKKRLRAFTLVELLIVIAVIGIVSSIATVVSTQVLRQARDSERGAKSSIVASSLEKYYEKNNGYPSVAALVGQNTSTLKNKLSLANPNSLIFPLASNTSNASIVASNPSPTQMAYLGATSNAAANNQCQTDANGYCDAYEIQYNNETDGSIVVIKSANGVVTPSTPPPAAPNTPTVSAASLSASQVRITSTAVTCASGTPEYKIRNAPTSCGLPAWSTISWGTSRIKDYNPGSDTVVYFQANARCVESGVPSAEVQSSIQSMNIGSAPNTPTVSASATSSSTIQLTFSSSGATSYSVSGAGSASSCSSSPCTVTGLAANTSYTFTVTASNSYGTSTAGSASATTQPPACSGVSSAPTISAGSATANSISVSWSAVSGDAPKTYYVYYGTSSPGTGYAGSTTSTSMNVTGLSSGTTYYFRVYAENCGGANQTGYSNTASATTNTVCTPPSAPSISAGSPTTSSITVSWGGVSGASSYDIYYGTSSPGSSYYGNTGSTSATIGSLSSGVTYYFRVIARGTGCNSGYSNTASATTTSCTSPSTPSGLNAQVDSSRQITLNWGSSSGTSPISYSLSGVGSVSANSSTVRTGLTPDTVYTYTLTATNSCGSRSSSVSPTTYGTISLSSGGVNAYANTTATWSQNGSSFPSTPGYSVTSSGSNYSPSCSTNSTSCTLNYNSNCTGSAPTITVSGHGVSSSAGFSWPSSPNGPGASIQQRWHNSIRVDWSQTGQTSFSQIRYKQNTASSWQSAGDSLSPTATVGSGSLNTDTVYDIVVFNSNCRYKECDSVNSNCSGIPYLQAPSTSLQRRTCNSSANSPCGP